MTRISDCEVGDACTIFMSHLSRASIGPGTRIGPYANVRPHTKIGEGVKIGNFVELKNAEVGDKSSLSHLTYVGDATFAERKATLCHAGCATGFASAKRCGVDCSLALAEPVAHG
jgi:bifunctional N-acetylglucosamine-1-phosphate-uridyltransferase/glucosamine-1-phosphate-acetyltransferase GlmU-like protein